MISEENDALYPDFYLCLEMKTYSETKLYSSHLPFYAFSGGKDFTSLSISAQLPFSPEGRQCSQKKMVVSKQKECALVT